VNEHVHPKQAPSPRPDGKGELPVPPEMLDGILGEMAGALEHVRGVLQDVVEIFPILERVQRASVVALSTGAGASQAPGESEI
jgi:hypothetical protein